MKLAMLNLAAVTARSQATPRAANESYTSKNGLSLSDKPWGGSYRVSPIDGSRIAISTKAQLDFQDNEIGVLIHFNIATYITPDGCNLFPWLVPRRDLFDPKLIDTNQWMDIAAGLGARYATLVTKHNCGFTTWPSKVSFRDTHGKNMTYDYTIATSPAYTYEHDVVRSFVESAMEYGIGHGFYYSTVVNNYLNVQKSEARGGLLADGQVDITTAIYDKIVLAHLGELWKQYGNLTEIWFDGGYSSSQADSIRALLKDTQPQAVVFGGCQADTCLSHNPIRWIGTEAGVAPEENWSTGLSAGGGDPDSPFFAPAECDTTLQIFDRWFYGVKWPLRSFKEMVDVYHQTVGRNCVLALDLAPDRTGLIPADHAARYLQLGNFIKSCYGRSVKHHRIDDASPGTYILAFDSPTPIDRIVLMENQANGQVIRSYKVYAKIVDVDGVDGRKDPPWTLVSSGTSIGHKKIDIFRKPITARRVMVNSTFVDVPEWRLVSVHLCDKF